MIHGSLVSGYRLQVTGYRLQVRSLVLSVLSFLLLTPSLPFWFLPLGLPFPPKKKLTGSPPLLWVSAVDTKDVLTLTHTHTQ